MADKGRRRELDRLADEIVPLLMARLGEGRLGELELRDGDWRVRVRRAARDGSADQGTRSAGSAQEHGRGRHGARRESSESHATAHAGAHGARPAQSAQSGGRLGTPSGNGETSVLEAVGPGVPGTDSARGHADEPRRVVARAPAVGYYIPADGISTGKIVAADDVIGQIDVLGVRQAVTAPAPGIVSRLLAQAGEAVEYGQELLQIDVVPRGDIARRHGASESRAASG